MQVGDFMPVFFKRRVFLQDQTVNLEEALLRPAASLVGQVRLEGSTASTAVVTIRPLLERTLGLEARLTQVKSATDSGGFFYLSGLGEGPHALSVRAEGFADATVDVSLAEGLRAELHEPIVLTPLVTMDIWITPSQAFGGGPWLVDLVSLERRPGRTNLEGQADLSGHWQATLPPGNYRLGVRSKDAEFERREIAVAPPGGPVFVEIGAISVAGQCLKGEEPIGGELLLISFPGMQVGDAGELTVDQGEFSHGESGGTLTNFPRRVELAVDSSGHFEGLLPFAGQWLASMRNVRGDQAIEIGPLEVKPGVDGRAWLQVRVPNQELRGMVLDPDGSVVEGAAVEAQEELGTRQGSASSDVEGRFTLAGLAEGEYQVQATKGRRSSETVSIEITDTPHSRLRLELRDEQRFEGLVRWRGSPVAGARVVAHWDYPRARSRETFSDLDGRFEIALPVEVTAATVVIIASQLPVLLVPMNTLGVDDDTASVSIFELPDVGGAIEVDGASASSVLLVNGAAILIKNVIEALLKGSGGSHVAIAPNGLIRLLGMAPGEYMVCSTASRCEAGFVYPRSSVRLAIRNEP